MKFQDNLSQPHSTTLRLVRTRTRTRAGCPCDRALPCRQAMDAVLLGRCARCPSRGSQCTHRRESWDSYVQSSYRRPQVAWVSPHHTSPHFTSPHLTTPSPHRTVPHLTAPHLTSPHLTSPHRTSPHHTSSEACASMARCLLGFMSVPVVRVVALQVGRQEYHTDGSYPARGGASRHSPDIFTLKLRCASASCPIQISTTPSPYLTSPHLTTPSPRLASPHHALTSPHHALTSPHLTSPHLTSPRPYLTPPRNVGDNVARSPGARNSLSPVRTQRNVIRLVIQLEFMLCSHSPSCRRLTPPMLSCLRVAACELRGRAQCTGARDFDGALHKPLRGCQFVGA